jgi:hypothetical protein
VSKTAYEQRDFRGAALEVVEVAETICASYAAQGYVLTLRGLYYQLIARDLFPASRRFLIPGSDGDYTANVTKNYKWLTDLVSDARIGGWIDWDHITDEGRVAGIADNGWDSPEDILSGAAQGYHRARWAGQPEHVEVWVEKAALGQVIRQAAGTWDVTTFECKGSPSTSAIHDAARRLRRHEARGVKCTVIYLGDHDPTGIDISRDIQDRLAMYRSHALVDRIALNMDQVLALNPPPSPVKVTDSRAAGYIDAFDTDECWELDAIDPPTLDAMIQEAIREHLDMPLRQEQLDREADERRQLTAVIDHWPDLLAYMQDNDMIAEPEGDEGDED